MQERLYIYTMKRELLIAVCLLLAQMAHAQKKLLQLNEQNKYIYYHVVDLPGISADSLLKNSQGFMESTYPKNKPEQINNTEIALKDKFLTYTYIVKHESGEINYTLNVECKDFKYRYWLTDFVFTPYERNRYGVFVPVNGINLPLETAANRLDKKELDGYLNQTGAFCKQLGENLQKYMAEGHHEPKIDKQPSKVVTDKW